MENKEKTLCANVFRSKEVPRTKTPSPFKHSMQTVVLYVSSDLRDQKTKGKPPRFSTQAKKCSINIKPQIVQPPKTPLPYVQNFPTHFVHIKPTNAKTFLLQPSCVFFFSSVVPKFTREKKN